MSSDSDKNFDWLQRGTSEIFPDRQDSNSSDENLIQRIEKISLRTFGLC